MVKVVINRYIDNYGPEGVTDLILFVTREIATYRITLRVRLFVTIFLITACSVAMGYMLLYTNNASMQIAFNSVVVILLVIVSYTFTILNRLKKLDVIEKHTNDFNTKMRIIAFSTADQDTKIDGISTELMKYIYALSLKAYKTNSDIATSLLNKSSIKEVVS